MRPVHSATSGTPEAEFRTQGAVKERHAGARGEKRRVVSFSREHDGGSGHADPTRAEPSTQGLSYLSLAHAIQVRQLQTDLGVAEWVEADEPPREALGRLAHGPYDQGPVRDGNHLLGFVLTRELAASQAQTCRPSLHPLDESVMLSASGSVLDILEAFNAGAPMSFVVDGRRITGFVTRSDLNKHQARAHFYLLLADLEIVLARQVREHFADKELAVALLEPDDQRKIRRRLSRDHENGLEVDLVTGMDLGHMLAIGSVVESIRCVFGLCAPENWQLQTAALPGLRNAVMHPVLEFLGPKRTVSDLVRTERTIRAMLTAAQADHRPAAPVMPHQD